MQPSALAQFCEKNRLFHMKRSKNPNKFLTNAELHQINTKIAAAEQMTSAEIKLVIVKHCLTSIKRKAHKIFKKYNLDQTAQRNCVLILVVTTNRQLLIYGEVLDRRRAGSHQVLSESVLEVGARGDSHCDRTARGDRTGRRQRHGRRFASTTA